MTQNSNNQDFTNNADGFALGGGTTERILTVTGGSATITGSGSAVVTLPASTSTLATLALTETLTNKTLTSPVINTPTGIVKGDVGLGNVDNTSNATERAATATLTNKTLTAPVISSIVNTGTLTLPTSTDTLVGRATTDTMTNKTISGGSNTISGISQSMLSFSTSSQANAGTAGGTMYYINLGGIKMLWGITTTFTIGANSDTTNLNLTLPTSFFSTINSTTASIYGNNNASYSTLVTCIVDVASTTTISLRMHNYGGGTTGNISMNYMVIGT